MKAAGLYSAQAVKRIRAEGDAGEGHQSIGRFRLGVQQKISEQNAHPEDGKLHLRDNQTQVRIPMQRI